MSLRSIRIKLGDISLRDKVLVAGFHGVGYVGWIAVRHIVKMYSNPRRGFIYTPYMQPYVSVSEGIKTPYELYDLGEVVVFVPQIPLASRDISLVPITLAEKFVEEGGKYSILIGGLDSRFREGNEKIRIAATSAFINTYKNVLEKIEARFIEENLYIVGPLAYMLTVFESENFPALTLLPYAEIGRPDPKAAAVAVEILRGLLGVKSKVEELLEEGERIEKEIEEIKSRIEKISRERETPPYYI